jgi:hypothetical protein
VEPVPVVALVYVSKIQTRYRLTLSQQYSARRLKTSSNGVMECDSSESKKRERSDRPSLANSSTCSSKIELLVQISRSQSYAKTNKTFDILSTIAIYQIRVSKNSKCSEI